MRNRKKQRKKRKKTIEKPWLNGEGYYDPTAYQALKNIEREEKSLNDSDGIHRSDEIHRSEEIYRSSGLSKTMNPSIDPKEDNHE